MLQIGLIHYILLASALFCIGLLSVIVSKNLIKVLIGVEFMLNAVNINLIAFSNYLDLAKLDGNLLTLFVMAVGVCELALGLAILILIFRRTQSVDAEEQNSSRG